MKKLRCMSLIGSDKGWCIETFANHVDLHFQDLIYWSSSWTFCESWVHSLQLSPSSIRVALLWTYFLYLFMLKDMNILHKWFYMPTSVPMFYLAKKRHMILFGGHLCDPALSSAFRFFFPQQRKLMVSSAQNSSRVHWCRRWVSFNEVPEKVAERSGRLWCRARSGSTRFRRRFCRRFRRRSGRLCCKARSGSTGFWRRLRRRSGRLWCRGQVQHGSGEGYGEVWEALVQSQVRFNEVPEKVAERSGRLWCRARSGSTRFRRRFCRRFCRRFRRRSGRLCCKARSGSTGFWRRLRRRSGRLWCRARSGSIGFAAIYSRKPSWGVSSAWLRSTLQKDL